MRTGMTGPQLDVGSRFAAGGIAAPLGAPSWASQSSWSSRLGARLTLLLDVVAVALRAYRVQRARRANARGLREALHALDDRTLRDLGFCRDEIASVVAEATGDAASSRMRTMRDRHGNGA